MLQEVMNLALVGLVDVTEAAGPAILIAISTFLFQDTYHVCFCLAGSPETGSISWL